MKSATKTFSDKELRFFDAVMVRTPLLPAAKSQTDAAAVLKKADFQLALLLASPSLYCAVQKSGFDFHQLSKEEQVTVRKYVNRSTYRSTPFGLFSSFAIIPWLKSPATATVLTPPEPTIKLDFAWLHSLWLAKAALLFTRVRSGLNPTLVAGPLGYRYMTMATIPQNPLPFALRALEGSRLLKQFFAFMGERKSFAEMKAFIMKKVKSADEQAAIDFLEELRHEGLLQLDCAPTISGTDYESTLLGALCFDSNINYLQHTLLQLNKPGHTIAQKKEQLLSISRLMQQAHPTGTAQPLFYALSRRNRIRGGLDESLQAKIKEGLMYLYRLAAPAPSQDLETFRSLFEKKYEGKEVRLLEVLDEQWGIGYGKQTGGFTGGAFTGLEHIHKDQKAGLRTVNNTVHAWLEQWQVYSHNNRPFELVLTDDLLQENHHAHRLPLPPSFSVLFRVLGDQVWIESAGGASALSLLGRFAADEAVHPYAQKIAATEQQYNPDVVFAEIAHICDLHVANINRRPHLRQYEIPVLTRSGKRSADVIDLRDLYISVIYGRVVLRSARLNQEVIPRLGSAFNYSHNYLPVFRFLCDVQSQDLCTDLQFSLSALLPGAPFYPRVVYKSCILQLAQWHITPARLAGSEYKTGDGDEVSAFRRFAEQIQLPRYFTLNQHDQFLLFDFYKDEDISLLLTEVKGKKAMVLQEYPFLETGDVTTADGKPLQSQYVASVYLTRSCYTPAPSAGFSRQPDQTSKSTNSLTEWIYFKLYCHPLTANFILTEYLMPTLKKLSAKVPLSCWFWIRYHDPEHHIRFRIQSAPANHPAVFSAFQHCAALLLSKQLVSRFETAVYEPELTRYTDQLIHEVEAVFSASSGVAAAWIRKYPNAAPSLCVLESVAAVLYMLKIIGFSPEQAIFFSLDQFNRYHAEMHATWQVKAAWEKLYKEELENPTLHAATTGKAYKKLGSALTAFTVAFHQKQTNTSLEKLTADLVHMHCNRMFAQEQRFLEMGVYHLVHRILKKNQMLEKKPKRRSASF